MITARVIDGQSHILYRDNDNPKETYIKVLDKRVHGVFIKDKDKKVDDKLSKITIKEYIETHDGVEKYAEMIDKKTKKDIKVK